MTALIASLNHLHARASKFRQMKSSVSEDTCDTYDDMVISRFYKLADFKREIAWTIGYGSFAEEIADCEEKLKEVRKYYTGKAFFSVMHG